MSYPVLPFNIDSRTGFLFRAEVLAADDEGRITVAREGDPSDAWRCIVLETAEGSRLELEADDTVLVWATEDDNCGIVLGRIGRSRPATPLPSRRVTVEPSDGDELSTGRSTPDELIIEARQSLTLRVGDGSITIRADGKILIKGKDLVSHAQRTNRIKGGAVAIN